MPVDNVKNSSQKSYILPATLLGVGAGATVGYISRPYIKNDELTDSFAKAVNIVIEEDEKDGAKMISQKVKNALKDINDIDNIEDLKKYASESKIVKKLNKLFDGDIITEISNAKSFENAKTSLKQSVKYSDYMGTVANLFKIKAALLYGVVAGSVIGVGTYLVQKFHNKN